MRLKLKYDKLLSSFAFNLYLRRYNMARSLANASTDFAQFAETLAVLRLRC